MEDFSGILLGLMYIDDDQMYIDDVLMYLPIFGYDDLCRFSPHRMVLTGFEIGKIYDLCKSTEVDLY